MHELVGTGVEGMRSPHVAPQTGSQIGVLALGTLAGDPSPPNGRAAPSCVAVSCHSTMPRDVWSMPAMGCQPRDDQEREVGDTGRGCPCWASVVWALGGHRTQVSWSSSYIPAGRTFLPGRCCYVSRKPRPRGLPSG